MKRLNTYLCVLIFSNMAGASSNETQQFINRQLEMKQQMQADPSAFRFQPPKTTPLFQRDQEFIAKLQAKQRQQLNGVDEKAMPRAIYFLSFSIPHEGVRQRINDAVRLNIPATLRGFVNNNLQDTATAMYDLVKETQRGGVQVDPTAFRKYDITAVPALVVICGDRSDRIAGNIRLEDMLIKVAEEGDCAELAKALLHEAGVAQ